MSNFNKAIIMGRLTRDPELRYSPKGTAICKISIAVNRTWKNEAGEKMEDCTFVDVDAFGRTAENIGQYFKKGSLIHIEGRLSTSAWTDKQTGQKRSKLGVVMESFQFVGGKPEEAEAGRPVANPAPKTDAGNAAPPEDDVPF